MFCGSSNLGLPCLSPVAFLDMIFCGEVAFATMHVSLDLVICILAAQRVWF